MEAIIEGIINNFSNPLFVVDFCISILLLGAISFLLLSLMRRKIVISFTIASDLIIVLSKIFSLETVSLISILFFLAFSIITVLINGTEYRYYILNNVSSRNRRHKESSLSKEDLSKIISDTVKNLSSNKIGAIITFEKTTNLNEVIKNGTLLNAPLCSELLMTIFYPGTRLHDGAVVIRGDTILAASVYYTPTTRALTGKYGSRHRAAFGISEVSDAVTIVVSEETGRISLTYKGRMESCSYDSFLSEFNELMNDSEE